MSSIEKFEDLQQQVEDLQKRLIEVEKKLKEMEQRKDEKLKALNIRREIEKLYDSLSFESTDY